MRSQVDLIPASLDYDALLERYLHETPSTHRKRYGQFFTPQPIAELMMNWILAGHPRTILDPAVGPGAFISEFVGRNAQATFLAVDLDPNVLNYARALNGSTNVRFVQDDFLDFETQASFDAIIANPPYLRHHDFDYAHDIFADVGKRNGIVLSRLTNLYGLFLIEICRRLTPGGRAAVIIPTEWTNANFGMPIKRFLLEQGVLDTFIYFTHEALPFDDALTTACVLLMEKPAEATPCDTVRTVYLSHAVSLTDLWLAIEESRNVVEGAVFKNISSATLLQTKKWDFLLQNECPPQLPGLVPLRALATTKRGIATGANDFFHLNASSGVAAGIRPQHLSPCIGKASDVQGLVFRSADFTELAREGKRTHLVNILGEPDAAECAYLQRGQDEGLSGRYLMAARKCWYQMEKRPAAPIWAAVFGRLGLRFIRNQAGVQNLTTFHCIYPANGDPLFCDALAVCLNSRFVQERARQQHRVYGGGLLKMEPRDLLDLEVPDLAKLGKSDIEMLADFLDQIDRAARTQQDSMDDILDRIDEVVRKMIGAAAAKPAALAQNDLPESSEV